MPQAPKCRVCGASHWSGQPHQFPAGARDPKRSPPATVVEAAAVARIEAKGAAAAAPDPLTEYLAQVKANRAAYMRDHRAGVRRRAKQEE